MIFIEKPDWPAVVLSICNQRKWTQKELAETIGVKPSTLNGWVNYGYEPIYSRGARLLKLAEKI